MQTNICTLELLSAELREFRASHNLDQDNEADMIYKRLPPGQERWLRDYSFRWDAALTLAPLAEQALAAEYESEAHERAHNAFYDALFQYMTNSQRREWEDRSLKATPAELITEAFRILGIPTGAAK